MEKQQNSRNVTLLLKRLISEWLGYSSDSGDLEVYLGYISRILSSHLKIDSSQTESSLKGLIHQKIQNNNAPNSKILLRCQELLQKFYRSRVIDNKFSVLYLLNKISDIDQNNTKNSMSIGGSLIGSILKKNNNNSLKSGAELSTMEIENSHNNASESLSRIKNKFVIGGIGGSIQTIEKIANKGNDNINLSESDLIRDVLYVLQGIDGLYIGFNRSEDGFVLKSSVPVSYSSRKLVDLVCELGWIFKKINEFLGHQPIGLIKQSLFFSIKEELNEYYQLLAVLENLKNENSSESLSLRKLTLWTLEPLERMKWLGILLESAESLIGGSALSAVHAYLSQGQPSVKELIHRILLQILNPFLNFVREWVYSGLNLL